MTAPNRSGSARRFIIIGLLALAAVFGLARLGQAKKSPASSPEAERSNENAGAVLANRMFTGCPYVCVTDFGATGTGNNDDTPFIQAAIDSLASTGGVVYFPPGTYRVNDSASLAINNSKGINIRGSGKGATVFLCNSATLDTFSVNGQYVRIEKVGFNLYGTSLTKTAGAFVKFSASAAYCVLDDFFMQNAFVGALVTGGGIYVEHGSIIDTARRSGGQSGSAGIIVGQDGQGAPPNDPYIVGVTMGLTQGNTVLPQAGIWVQACGDCFIRDCDITNSNIDLYVTGASSLYAQNSFFDFANYGIFLFPVNQAITRCHFIGCWASDHLYNGIYINQSNPAPPSPTNQLVVDNVEFVNMHVFFNGGGPTQQNQYDGISIGNGTNMKICDSDISNNYGSGISVSHSGNSSADNGLNHFILTGNRIGLTNTATNGPRGRASGNLLGLWINANTGAAPTYYFIISNNDLTSNTYGNFVPVSGASTVVYTNNLQ